MLLKQKPFNNMNGYSTSTFSRRLDYIYVEGQIVTVYATSFPFSRGFTGHEHYDRFHIVNANARLYDPVIGRFFSNYYNQGLYPNHGYNDLIDRIISSGWSAMIEKDFERRWWHFLFTVPRRY